MEEIVNRVEASGLMSFDLEDWYPQGERIVYDLKQNLFMDLILKEKDFREFIKTHDWSFYQDKYVAVVCSTDAIIPTWAYMLLSLHLKAKMVVFGDLELLETKIMERQIDNLDLSLFTDARVVVKGCSHVDIPTQVYMYLSQKLQPIVKSLMFGEPCSTVPLFKRKVQI